LPGDDRFTNEEEAMLGRLLWFSEAKNHGFIRTEEGERLYVDGSAFAECKQVAGRCRGLPVSFEVAVSDGGRSAADVSLVPQAAARRARLRGRGAVRS
jgi:cold shock CspA family protein